ncbi:MAG: methyltransferase [Marmoricola sp.]
MSWALAGPLAEALDRAGYRYNGVAERLGATAHLALSRNETTPAMRATAGGDHLDTLMRLWLLQQPVPLEDAEAALPGLVDRLCVEGVLRRSVGEVAAAIDVRPYATESVDLWVASDLTPGLDGSPNAVSADHVLGISSASTSLAQMTVRTPVSRALDLGTGCGVQALHLAAHAVNTVATDVNKRALWLTNLNLALNGISGVNTREGSFFEPVAHEVFDLIVTNPPFVISPATGERLVYRDSGLPGDQVVEHVVRRAPQHLTSGGLCQILANWAHVEGREWGERLGEWVTDCEAFIVEREVLDPAEYVELWLRDSGHQGAPDYTRRYDTWLSWFEEQQITGIGFGWINLRKSASGSVTALAWPHAIEQPIGPAISAHFDASTWLALASDDALRASHLVLRADVAQETVGSPGAEDPEAIVLRQQVGLRRAWHATTAEAALVGACDGDLSIGQIMAALDDLIGVPDPAALVASVRTLVEQGFLQPQA